MHTSDSEYVSANSLFLSEPVRRITNRFDAEVIATDLVGRTAGRNCLLDKQNGERLVK